MWIISNPQKQLTPSHSRATAGIYWEDVGMFNGMLLRDFVLNGFQVQFSHVGRAVNS